MKWECGSLRVSLAVTRKDKGVPEVPGGSPEAPLAAFGGTPGKPLVAAENPWGSLEVPGGLEVPKFYPGGPWEIPKEAVGTLVVFGEYLDSLQGSQGPPNQGSWDPQIQGPWDPWIWVPGTPKSRRKGTPRGDGPFVHPPGGSLNSLWLNLHNEGYPRGWTRGPPPGVPFVIRYVHRSKQRVLSMY